MQSTASQLNSQSDNINIMQPQPTQNMYAPTSGTANSSNVRTNQQTGLFRGALSSNPSPRPGTRQVPMQNMYQQPMHHGLVVSTFGAYPPRQQTFQNPQPFSFPHSSMPPPQNYFYSNIYMPPQPQHRATMSVNAGVSGAMSGPNVQLAGPPGAAQGQIPISTAQVVAGPVPPGAPGVLGVGPTTAQVGTSQMVGLVPGSLSTHPVQTSKQPKSHPNRLKIIDPSTNKNILDDFELNKSSTNVDVEFQDLQQLPTTTPGDYQITSAPSTDHTGLSLGSSVLLITDPRPSLPYNMRFDTDIQQIQQQRDLIVSQTPVVSAMSDAPSIEIPPTQKPRSKKIAITAPKPENVLPVIASNSEEKDKELHQTAALNQFDGNSITNSDNQESVSNDKNPENSYENLEPICSISNEESSSQDISFNLHKQTIAKPQSEPFIAEESSSSQANNTKSGFDNIETALVNMKITEASAICEPVQSTSVEFISSSNSVTIESLGLEQEIEKVNLESKTRIDSDTNSNAINKNNILDEETTNVEELKSVTFLNADVSEQVMCDETDRAINVAMQDTASKENVLETMQKETTTEEKPESITSTVESNQEDEPKVSDIAIPKEAIEPQSENGSLNTAPMNSLITYNEGQWSPNNPDGKKQYNRKQLMRLREAQASRIQPAVKNTTILTQKNFMPSFIKYNNNKRVQSMMGSIGGNRGGDMNAVNYGSKQSSMSGVYGRNMAKDKIQVNLSLNQDVKLNETDNAWRPRALLKSGDSEIDSQSNTQQKEELIRRVRGILNKLTPEKFDTLVEEIIKLKIDTPDKMEDVMVLVFEKAIDEPNFSVSYARLCHRLISEVKARDERMESDTKTNLALFRSALIDKTEREFVQNVTGTSAKEEKLKPIIEKIKNATDLNEKAELEALLEEEERKIRRRSVGTVRFIGELFKISMLTGKIIKSCITTLLRNNNEDMLECLCKLLTTVGAKFEQTLINPKEDQKTYHSLDKTMAKMQAIASKTDKEAKVSSRVRFMLQDVIDLRKKNWQLTRNEAPKTMEQIEKETKSAQLSSHYLNYSGSLSTSGAVNSNGPQMGSNNKRDDRGGNRFSDSRSGYGGSHSQRGEAGSMRRQQGGNNSGNSGGLNVGNSNGTNDDNTWHVQTGKGSRSTGIDTNKLEGLHTNLDMKKMGGLSQFLWNKDVRQSSIASTTPSNSFAALSSLMDSKNSDRDLDRDRDRDRDRGVLRNKGSFNKNSMERERYGGDRGLNSRSVTSQGTRENSSSRNSQGMRGMMNASSMQKSTSQSKYSHQMPSSRLTSKSAGIPTISSGPAGLYHRSDQSSSSEVSSYSAPPTVYEEPSASELKLIKSVVTDLLEGAANTNIINASVVSSFSRIDPSQRCGFLGYILTEYLHLAGVCQIHRRYLANIVDYLLQSKTITLDHFRLAYKHFCKFTNDLIFDVPDLWLYVIEFTGPLIAKHTITVKDLWNKQLMEENVESGYSLGNKFLKTFLAYCTREIGPNFTRTMWKNFDMKWTDFVPAAEVQTFIASNNFEFIEDESKQPVIEVKKEKEKEKLVSRIVERIDLMLREGSSRDSIIDYINGNIVDIDKFFIRSLTTTLCNFSIAYKDDSYKLDIDRFQKECIPLLQRYINSEPEKELECLIAMQVLVNKLEHPRGLLSELFGELYDSYVIPQESFTNWRDSKDQSAGKGVAIKGLNPFFNHVLCGETSDENN